MNKKSVKERAEIIQLLTEGNSLRGTSRITGAALNTVTSLLVHTGTACSAYQDGILKNLPCERIQIDEIWSYIYAKNKNVTEEMGDKVGDLWTFTAICPETKLVPTWFIGKRDAQSAKYFIADLIPRMTNKIHLSSDGFAKYRDAVEDLMIDIDYGMLYKLYDDKNHYAGARKLLQLGNPDRSLITTAHVERQNLTMRMSIRRFARKTNAFSKKAENHACSVALHFMNYNFCRIHKTLRVTPAMEAGITDHVWSFEDIAKMID